MSNPAWKKTAERMTPKGFFDPSRPNSSLTLDWVHGYRGFDCRNNVRYADDLGSQILYTAAALSIIQSKEKNGNGNMTNKKTEKKQTYFGEHTDDVISVAMQDSFGQKDNTSTLIASGEIGKIPAINIYNWNPLTEIFEMLATVKGFHTGGVSQLCFSRSGGRLFSVGIDYTVAVYDTEKASKSFGKMVSITAPFLSHFFFIVKYLFVSLFLFSFLFFFFC
jgi:WD40 repeat protein